MSSQINRCLSATTTLNRRKLIQVGTLGMLGLSLPELLAAERSAGAGRKKSAKSCIFVVQYGGASHIDTLDPKPHAPQEIRGPYEPIATSVPGIQLSSMLPRLAELAQHYCLVRSLTHDKSVHSMAMDVCLTGQTTPLPEMPTWCSVVSRLKPATARLPSYLWIEDLDRDVRKAYLDGGSLGRQYGPMLIAARDEHFASPGYRVKLFDVPEGLDRERLGKRFELLKRLNTVAEIDQRSGPRDFCQFQQQALELVSGKGAAQAFDLERERPSLRDRYGRHPFGQNLLAARRLVEAGARLVAVNAWCGYPENEEFIFTQGWDHHGAAAQKGGIFSNTQHGLGFVLPRFDQALSALLEDLNRRGMLEETLVVVVGEFGRTPKISQKPHVGRDHWPQCYSALLAGGGIRGGSVWGRSGDDGGYVKQDAVTPEDFTATIYQALGITMQDRLSLGERIPIINGHPVQTLFG